MLATGIIADSYNKPSSGGLPVTGYVAWFDANDAASITSSGGAVSQWNDKSGNARHVTQATGANQPITGTRTLNSLNVLDFNGTTHQLASANVVIAQPLTLFVVAQYDNVDTANRFMVCASAAGLIMRTNAGNWQISAATASLGGGTDDANPHVFAGIYNGASSEFWIDGALKVSGNPGTAAWSTLPIRIGGTSFWDGTIAEVVIYVSALSTTDRQSVGAYLKSKWGTP